MVGDQNDPESMKAFGAAFLTSLQEAAAQASAEPPLVLRALLAHFDGDVKTFPIVTESFEAHEHPNLHLAIERYLASNGRSAELIGVSSDVQWMEITFAQLLARMTAASPTAVTDGPVQYVNLDLQEGEVVTCVQRGLYLIRDDDERIALLLRGPSDFGHRRQVSLEVMARDRAVADRVLVAIRRAMRERNIYRSRVLQLGQGGHGELSVQFHRLPTIARDQIILPAGLLERIERQTIRFAELRDRLRAAGRHLRRGMLLYGPPGTGKTLTAMYLSSQMRDRTVLLLAGPELGLLRPACAMARVLQPATVLLEDVDLIAEQRSHPATMCNPLLYELLNQMDGLQDDADVLFLLTTNRPDILEPALASRPGRIDLAIEIPLPDAECRRRLIDLYARGLNVSVTSWHAVVAQTEGASAAFMRELMRRAALLALDDRDDGQIDGRHVTAALHELVFDGGPLTRSLLGARLQIADRPDPSAD
jgi:ATPase family associated with various cellular activities (AAA)